MENECGLVREIKGDKMLVEAQGSPGCSSCPAGHTCMVSADKKIRTIWMDNAIGACAGDTVEFEVSAAGVASSSFLFYIFPVFMLMAGMAAGNRYCLFDLTPELNAALTGLFFFVVSFLIMRPAASLISKKKSFAPRAVKIIVNGGNPGSA